MAGNILQAMVSIAGEVDASLSKAVKKASASFSGLKKAAKVATAATAAGMAAATAATVKAVEAAADYESDFAKTATLLSGTSEELQEYSDSILQMSNDTGVAASELTDTVYNAISAGVDQADAVEFAGQAAKLAAGGFTDSATAVDVMTTALNAYGLEADQASNISDYLITTQNLGKTTVDELASSVGKVIPIASAYGVEMDNLSAAYAQLTAGGIATAESGTYLKSMLNELGDSGSTVSAVLEAQTGQSFAELTESGKSLGDIMQILGDSVGGDAGAFNELWSSSEAGVGALSLLNSGADAYNETLQAMRDSTGATDDAYATMTDTLDYQIQTIKNLGKNFLIEMGQDVLPIVEEVAEVAIPMLTEALESAGDIVGPMLEDIAESTLPFLNDGIQTIWDVLQGVLPYVAKALKLAMSILQKVLPLIADLAESVMPVLEEVLDAVFDAIDQILPIISDTITTVLPVLSSLITALLPAIQSVLGVLTPIISLIGTFISSILPPVINTINLIIPIINSIATVISTVLAAAINLISPMLAGIIGIVQAVGDTFSTIFSGLVGIVKAPVNAIISLANKAISAINSISIDIPDWAGGGRLGFNIATIPMMASGGFTDGTTIAGEAGTEAVISFDPAYRSQNLSYWAKAGQMLGATNSDLLSLLEGGSSSGGSTTEINLGGVSFAPNITIAGSASKDDILAAIREAEPEFFDFLDDYIKRRGEDAYEPAY